MSFDPIATMIGNPYFHIVAAIVIIIIIYLAARRIWIEIEPKDFNIYKRRSKWKKVLDCLLRA